MNSSGSILTRRCTMLGQRGPALCSIGVMFVLILRLEACHRTLTYCVTSGAVLIFGVLVDMAGPSYSANTGHWPIAGLMLVHRLRRWSNINPALFQRHVFSGPCVCSGGCVWWLPLVIKNSVGPMLCRCWGRIFAAALSLTITARGSTLAVRIWRLQTSDSDV